MLFGSAAEARYLFRRDHGDLRSDHGDLYGLYLEDVRSAQRICDHSGPDLVYVRGSVCDRWNYRRIYRDPVCGDQGQTGVYRKGYGEFQEKHYKIMNYLCKFEKRTSKIKRNRI